MKLLSIILSLNMLVASTGIPVYTHLCKASNKKSVSVMEMDCAMALDAKSCCAVSNCSDPSSESLDDCCESDGDWYRPDLKATIELKKLTSGSLPALDIPIFTLSIDLNSGNDITVFPGQLNAHPPNAGASQAALQVFRC